MLLHCSVINPRNLWMENWECLTEDVLYRQSTLQCCPRLTLSDSQRQAYGLAEIEEVLRKYGQSLHDIKDMPKPNRSLLETVRNQLIAIEMSCNREQLSREFMALHQGLNKEQLNAYVAIVDSVQ